MLAFDVETTGLPKSYKARISDSENWPRLVQLAWCCTEEEGKIWAEKSYIIKPDGFFIPKEASDIHGVTHEQAMDEGVGLECILEEFHMFLEDTDYVVGHNINFDKKIVYAEFYRLDMKFAIDLLHGIEKICTMFKSTKHCQLPKPSGRGGCKWPKLQELHQVLFGEEFIGAHDALADIRATARCYWELVRLEVIEIPVPGSYIPKIYPHNYK